MASLAKPTSTGYVLGFPSEVTAGYAKKAYEHGCKTLTVARIAARFAHSGFTR